MNPIIRPSLVLSWLVLSWLVLLALLSVPLSAQTSSQSSASSLAHSQESLPEAIDRVIRNYPPAGQVFDLIADEVDLIAADLMRSEQALIEAQKESENQREALRLLRTDLEKQGTELQAVSSELTASRTYYEGEIKTRDQVILALGLSTVILLGALVISR